MSSNNNVLVCLCNIQMEHRLIDAGQSSTRIALYRTSLIRPRLLSDAADQIDQPHIPGSHHHHTVWLPHIIADCATNILLVVRVMCFTEWPRATRSLQTTGRRNALRCSHRLHHVMP